MSKNISILDICRLIYNYTNSNNINHFKLSAIIDNIIKKYILKIIDMNPQYSECIYRNGKYILSIQRTKEFVKKAILYKTYNHMFLFYKNVSLSFGKYNRQKCSESLSIK